MREPIKEQFFDVPGRHLGWAVSLLKEAKVEHRVVQLGLQQYQITSSDERARKVLQPVFQYRKEKPKGLKMSKLMVFIIAALSLFAAFVFGIGPALGTVVLLAPLPYIEAKNRDHPKVFNRWLFFGIVWAPLALVGVVGIVAYAVGLI